MKLNKIIVICLVALIFASGCISDQPQDQDNVTSPTETETPSEVLPPSYDYDTENPKLLLAASYNPQKIHVDMKAPSYKLPLQTKKISNIESINNNFALTDGQLSFLEENGFVIIPYGHEGDIVKPYKDLKARGVPIFVTTDSVLHLYHIQFDEILKGVEEREFYGDITELSRAMMEKSESDYKAYDDDLKEAARRNTAFFAVPLKLLDPKAKIPKFVSDEVKEELDAIEAHEGFKQSVIFCYKEDYSQYVPRGHYTQSDTLKRYFKAMMWYGRMAFLLKGGDECLLSEEDAKIATIQAFLISEDLKTVKVGGNTAQEIWNRIYAVTAFFSGTADDLTPYEYQGVMEDVFGSDFDFNSNKFTDDKKLLELKVELANMENPQIYGGTGDCTILPPFTPEKLDECLSLTKGMRFMGQRFVPDSYIFQNLVSPAVGMYVGDDAPFTMVMTDGGPVRGFPRGLDVMAVLGSKRADEILEKEGDTEYAGPDTSYEIRQNMLKDEFRAFGTSDWNRNLYWSWLYALKPLLIDFDEGYPTFMQTDAWKDKELQTSLASWAELRHDTILYAKQSYTPTLTSTQIPHQTKPVVGYVEPVPEFYVRMAALTKMTNEGLTGLNVLNQTEKARLEALEGALNRLVEISKDELENKELTEEDYAFIRNFGENVDAVVAGVDIVGKETTIIADVHTDTNSGQVLEEGIGHVNLILVAYKVPDSRIIIGAGPVFSYYEFKHNMGDRLTDEKWKEMLGKDPPEMMGWLRDLHP